MTPDMMSLDIFIIAFFVAMFSFIVAIYYEVKHTYKDDDLWKK